jgi:hypothetical protein
MKRRSIGVSVTFEAPAGNSSGLISKEPWILFIRYVDVARDSVDPNFTMKYQTKELPGKHENEHNRE